MRDDPTTGDAALRVILFSGGRGSGALTTALVRMPGVDVTLAINGYDDGASTGEVRRFLGDALGPSDFRKNASRLATALGELCAGARAAARSAVCPRRLDRDGHGTGGRFVRSQSRRRRSGDHRRDRAIARRRAAAGVSR